MDLMAIAAGGGAGLLIGLVIGLVIRRPRPDLPEDWKTRLRSRDDDLQLAEERASDAALRLEAATAQLARLNSSSDHRPAVPNETPLTPPRFPQPASHFQASEGEQHEASAEPNADDLTMIPGLDESAAGILAEAGTTTFRALAQLGSDGAVVPDSVAETLADRLPDWAAEAARLHEARHAGTV